MKRALAYGIPLLQLLAIVALLACAIAGCGKARDAQVAHTKQVAQKHIAKPLRPISDDIDRQLGHASGFGIAATGLAIAALPLVALEASAFLRIALAIAAGCAFSTFGLFALRLSVPILAIAIPWTMGALVLSGLLAAWLWYKHQAPVCLKNPLRCLLPLTKAPTAPPLTSPE